MLSNEERFQCLHEIIDAARETLNADIWDYLQGGTDSETTLKRNRLALDSLALRPRVRPRSDQAVIALYFPPRLIII